MLYTYQHHVFVILSLVLFCFDQETSDSNEKPNKDAQTQHTWNTDRNETIRNSNNTEFNRKANGKGLKVSYKEDPSTLFEFRKNMPIADGSREQETWFEKYTSCRWIVMYFTFTFAVILGIAGLCMSLALVCMVQNVTSGTDISHANLSEHIVLDAVEGTREEWQVVFFICVGVTVGGTIIYAIFASGEEQDWAKDKDITIEVDRWSDNLKLSSHANEGFENDKPDFGKLFDITIVVDESSEFCELTQLGIDYEGFENYPNTDKEADLFANVDDQAVKKPNNFLSTCTENVNENKEHKSLDEHFVELTKF